jgi:hypothetical protein
MSKNVKNKVNPVDTIKDVKYYESAVLKNDYYAADTIISLGIVKKYIQEHKLILVGGIAIDMALKLKGDKLYDDDILPDYDFYSTAHYKDAYMIAENLSKAGLKNITVINANHVSTMRVRVNYIVIADITYVPEKVFNSLLKMSLNYRGLNVVHPHYQMIDQHRSLSIPYENPPREVILSRWKKDMTRYDLLYSYYTLDDAPQYMAFDKVKLISLKKSLVENQCIGGVLGLFYWFNKATKMGYKSKYTGFNKNNFNDRTDEISASMPESHHVISIYSNKINKLYEQFISYHKIDKTEYYTRFLDKIPSKVLLNETWELLDNSGHMIGAHLAYPKDNIYVSNLQHIMMYLLTNYILQKPDNAHKTQDADLYKLYHKYYLVAYDIVKWASALYNKTDNIDRFLPTHLVYGDKNISDSYLNSKRLYLENIKLRPRDNLLQPNIVFPNDLKNNKIQKKYYDFDYTKSHIFNFSGGIVKKMQNRFVDYNIPL